jgi:NADH-quinone oxidoreductase subunit N
MMDWFVQAPELAAVAIAITGAVICLLFAPLLSAHRGSALAIGLLGCIAAALPALVSDSPKTLEIAGASLLTFVAFLLAPRAALERDQEHVEVAVLLFLALASAVVLATTTNLLSLVISLEGLSLTFVVLAAISAGTATLEAAFKYFILASVSAAFMIYGVGLYAYTTGTLSIGATAAIEPAQQPLFVLSVVLIGLGAAFELALAPMHFGGLGLYIAGPPVFSGYAMCTGKLAATLALVRLLDASGCQALSDVLLVMGVLSIVWGTLGAIAQRELRHLLGYSAISHAGFIGLALGSGEPGRAVAIYYALGYAASAFLVFSALERLENGPIALADLPKLGLSRSSTLALVAGLASLAGIPPLPGFWGKVGVLWAAWQGAGTMATALAAACGVAGVVFYLKPVPALLASFRRAPVDGHRTPYLSLLALVLAGAAVLAFSVLPQLAADLVQTSRP